MVNKKMDRFTLYDGLTANPNYQFRIVGGVGKKLNVSGVMQNELSIAGDNDYSTAKELMDAGLSVLGGIGQKIQSFREHANLALRMSGRSSITDYESRLVWNSSSKPQFTIEYKIYNMSDEISLSTKGALYMAKALQMGVLPDKGKPSPTRKGLFYRAPLGYKFLDKKGGVQGTVTLEIGKWFRASNLIIRSTNFTPSIQVMKSGQPLYVSGNVVLEPFQLISYKEFLQYFRLGE